MYVYRNLIFIAWLIISYSTSVYVIYDWMASGGLLRALGGTSHASMNECASRMVELDGEVNSLKIDMAMLVHEMRTPRRLVYVPRGMALTADGAHEFLLGVKKYERHLRAANLTNDALTYMREIGDMAFSMLYTSRTRGIRFTRVLMSGSSVIVMEAESTRRLCDYGQHDPVSTRTFDHLFLIDGKYIAQTCS
jgi:hypothetical protein